MITMKTSFKHTLFACSLGSVTQAIIINFAPLLFLTFQSEYGVSLDKITLLVTVNFGTQLLVNLLGTRLVDRIGYRPCVVTAHLLAALGLVGLAVLPPLFSDPFWGLLLAASLYAIGGGIIEVVVSPIIEACPTENKAATMSLMHSFFCWGHMFVVLASTLFFVLFGTANWRLLACIWAVVPLCNALFFTRVPILQLAGEGSGPSLKKLFFSKLFWVFVLMIFCAGAVEQGMAQWASAFAESGLHVSKTVGDLAGPCLFAACMGISRVFYAKSSGKIRLSAFMLLSGVFCAISFILAAFSPWPVLSLAACGLCGLAVGVLWPGTLSLASAANPAGGTAMFAFFAFAGNLGCTTGPAVVGLVSGAFGGSIRIGLAAVVIFPLLLIAGLFIYKKLAARQAETL